MTGQGHTRYKANRYYVSNRIAWAVRQKIKPIRAKAANVERLVLEALKAFLADRVRLRLALTRTGIRKGASDELIAEGAKAASRLERLPDRQLGCALRALLWRVEVHQEVLRLVVRLDAVPLFLRWEGSGIFSLTELEKAQAREFYVLDVPVAVSNQHKNHSLPVSEECDAPRHDRGLISLLYDARLAQRMVFDNRDKPISELARTFGRRSQSFVRLVRLNYLAPDIVGSILDGGQPKGLTRKSLMKADLPVDWILQRKLLGYAPIAQSELPSIALEHRSMLPNIWSGQ